MAVKKLVLTLMAVGLSTASFSQKAFILSHLDKKGFVALSAGVSQPLGRFASCSPVDERAGMAARGLAFNVSAGYQLIGPAGLMVWGERHRNALQTRALLSNLYRNDTDVWTATADDWSVVTLMGGPYVNLPMGRFSVDARLLAGWARASLPGTVMNGNFGNLEMGVNTTGSQSASVAIGGGLSLRYRLGRILSLCVNSDYTHARFRFDNLTSTAWSSNGKSESSRFSSDRMVSAVSLSVGLVVLFGDSYRPF